MFKEIMLRLIILFLSVLSSYASCEISHENFWKCALKNKLQVLNISTEPILFKEILDLFSVNTTSTKLIHENMKSHYSKYWGKTGDYLYSEDEIKLDLKNYIKNQLK